MNVNKTNTQCQVCGDSLLNGDLVVCYHCHTPHHEDCWDYVQQCSTFGCNCHKCNKIDVADMGLDDTNLNRNDCLIETYNEPPQVSQNDRFEERDVIEIDETGTGWKNGRRIRQIYHDVPNKIIKFDHGNNWLEEPTLSQSARPDFVSALFVVLYVIFRIWVVGY